jgi:hypothetical protein
MRTPMAVFAQRKASRASMGVGTPAGMAAAFALVSAVKSDVTIKPGTTVKLKLLHAPTQPA